MSNFKIAAAQIASLKGDIEANINRHIVVLKEAAKHNVDFVIFPELSLTGYELELAQILAVDINDIKFSSLVEAAVYFNITFAAGILIKTEGLPKLGLIIVNNKGERSTYCKMNIHSSEENYFSFGNEYHFLEIKDEKIGLAICADINNPNHIKTYAEKGATIYAASVLISENGYQSEIEKLHKHSVKHNLHSVLSNHNEPTGKYVPAGKSGIFYSKNNSFVGDKSSPYLVIAEKNGEQWKNNSVPISY